MTNSVQAEEIPQNLEGLAYYQKAFTLFLKNFAREIDHLFYEWGYESVPPTYRYVLAGSVCSLPLVLVLILICCCTDDFDEEEAYREYERSLKKKKE